jgi:signal transduction histidine kinase/CheY-like chemotaxis protein/ABC-type sugar transport system substrate-binding protein
MRNYKHNRPTIGTLADWQVYVGTLDTFLGPVYRGIRSAAHNLECNLLLSCSVDFGVGQGSPRLAWPVPAPDVDFIPVGPWNADGLIVAVPIMSRERSRYYQHLIAQGYPVVFVGAGESGPAVIADNEGGICQAVAHLVEHGHRRVAFIAGHEDDVDGDCARRLHAYRAAVQEYGLEADANLVAYGSHNMEGGQRAMGRLLAAGVSFTAMIASNDVSAIGAMQALSHAGLLVPHDVAVVGFDDRLEAAAHVPPLTTVRYPTFEQGYQGLKLLLDYIEGRAEGVKTVRIPTQLIVRESCGCLPGTAALETRPVASDGRRWQAGKPAPPASDGRRWQAGKPAPPAPDGRRWQAGKPAPPAPDGRGWQAGKPAPLDGKPAPPEGIVSQVVRAMARKIEAQMQRLSQDEVYHLCQRLMEAYALSLEQRDSTIFLLALQQILQRVMILRDDPAGWQAAVSILREHVPALLEALSAASARQQMENMLDQARLAISEAAHEQYVRHLLRQAGVADQVGRMTARFLAAQDEAEIFDVLAENLPGIGIQHAAVALYEPEGEDPVAWSVLQAPPVDACQRRFPSRQFPPAGLYPADRPFSLALLPLLVQEGISGFVAFDSGNLEPCADIVRQLAAALRGIRLYREAVEARRLAEEGRQLAEEANRLKSRFLSMVSHELRTPLNLICGLSNILLREGEQAGPREYKVNIKDVERIYIGAQHLDGLIRDVLDLAQSDVGQLKLVCAPLDLTEVLRAVAVIGEQLARDKELAWRAEIPERLPWVWGDRTRLRQVVLNLVNNAVKFTARGEVSLTANVEDRRVTVSVHDTGLGVPADEQEAIFDEFRQSERTTARGYGGLGLGLAICKRLIEMHEGKIGVYSSGEEGKGSTFYFTLPVVGQAFQPVAEIPLAQAQRVSLLAKDAAGGRVLREHLARQGFEVEVHPADEATGWLARLVLAPPDVVVLDLGLTSERGWEILKTLKETPATQDVPVLFYALEGDEDSGAGPFDRLRAGFPACRGSLLEINYLTKPVGTAKLAEALTRHGLLDEEEREQAGKNILIVDDEPGILEMHTRMVEAQVPGCRVLRAQNGREALEAIRQERPDLVLLDLMMPELDGFGVLEAMQEEEMSRHIPVIVLTGQVLTEEDMARLNRGVASVLEKGLFSVEETLEHVAAALERKRRPGSETQRIVLKAMAFIHAHYAEQVSRRDIAAHVGLSERHLDRCFRQEVGVTPITYLNRYRVRQAKALLEAGGRSITEVAMEVGFSSGGYFTRVFRQEVGVPPRTFLRSQ